MILAPEKFRDIEYIVPRAFFEQKNYTVMTSSISKKSVGTFGYEVENDFLLDEINVDIFDAICFVGGSGSLTYMENKKARVITEKFIQSGKVVSAICAAPRNLLKWGILFKKNCTGWNGDGEFLKMCKQYGAYYLNKGVVTDGKCITADGPSSSENFALAIIAIIEKTNKR